MVGIVWLVKKVRYLIEGPANSAILYTDHSAAVGLMPQTSLSTSSVEKLYLRLDIQNYQQQFRIEICYNSGKTNMVLNTSSNLVSRDYGPQ